MTGSELLLLVRHGAAEERHPDGDAARALTPHGVAGVRAAAAAVATRTRIARVLTSPYARAVQTADLLAEALGGPPVETRPALGAETATAQGLARLAEEIGPGVALVGHNPSITEAAALLLGRPAAMIQFRPGTMAALARQDQGWTLRWVGAAGGVVDTDFR